MKSIDLEAYSNEEPFDELAIRIQHYLTESKPYTNPDFSVQDLSNALMASLGGKAITRHLQKNVLFNVSIILI